MEIGDRIKFPFGGEEKEGTVVKLFPKKVYLKVDFPKHPGKILIRALADLEGTKPAKKNKKRDKAEKEKKARKEKREKAKAAEAKSAEEAEK
ncbi:MAG TPA: hypothetical protein VLS90_18650 [Thermodesulfobacteriota bacterium]|nr:hypothetical protein [Thermodesulfobacteriota bacterium]